MGLARVMAVKEPGRTLELADDYPLGAVDHKNPGLGHQRNASEINRLLLDVADALGAAVRVGIVGDQANRDLDRHFIGHPPLDALFHGVFRFAKGVVDELQGTGPVEIPDRENTLENPLQTLVQALVRRHIQLQKLREGAALHLDEMGFCNNRPGLGKTLPESFDRLHSAIPSSVDTVSG